MEKMCSYCREVKPIEKFRFLNKQNRYIAYCKECEKEYDRAYQKERRANKAVAKQELIQKGVNDVLNQFCNIEGITRQELNEMSKEGQYGRK